MVDESIVDRPLDLDDAIARKEELGNVRFEMCDLFRIPGIDRGIEQGIDQLLLVAMEIRLHRFTKSSRIRSNTLIAGCHTGEPLACGDRLWCRFGRRQLAMVDLHMMDHIVEGPEEKELHEEPTDRAKLTRSEIEKLYEENRDQDPGLERLERLQLISFQQQVDAEPVADRDHGRRYRGADRNKSALVLSGVDGDRNRNDGQHGVDREEDDEPFAKRRVICQAPVEI